VIRLTRINRTSLAINGDLIKFVECAPDTVITLVTGEKVVVTESVEQVIEMIVQFRRTILTGLACPALGLPLGTTTNLAGLQAKSESHVEVRSGL
jgi:flagellar protein FlbD